MRVLFPFWSGGLRFLCCRMITLTIGKLTLIHPWFPIWNYLLTASIMQMTKLSWNWESSVKNAFISITSFWEFLRPELLRAVVLQGAPSSGKAHLKLTSGRETFPSLLRESCVTADPCSVEALISWCFLQPPSNMFSWERGVIPFPWQCHSSRAASRSWLSSLWLPLLQAALSTNTLCHCFFMELKAPVM